MNRCVVEPGLEFESSLFARELLEELRISMPSRIKKAVPPPVQKRVPPVEMPAIIIDEEYERWDGLG